MTKYTSKPDIYSKTSSRTRINTDPQFMQTNFSGPISPWFYTEMPTDNTDSVSTDFRITQTAFVARQVPKYTS